MRKVATRVCCTVAKGPTLTDVRPQVSDHSMCDLELSFSSCPNIQCLFNSYFGIVALLIDEYIFTSDQFFC